MYTKGEWKITKYGYHEITEGEYREYTYHIGGDSLTNVAVAHTGNDALLIATAPSGYELAEFISKISAAWIDEGLLEIGEGDYIRMKQLALNLISKAKG